MLEDRHTLQVRLSAALYNKMKELAVERGITVSEYVRNYILEYHLFNPKIR